MNFTNTNADPLVGETGDSFYIDLFSFGDRTNNAIYRMLLEETGDNTATFVGEVEFIMLNQINIDRCQQHLVDLQPYLTKSPSLSMRT